MRALTIRQPWAWAVMSAGKRIENRSDKRGLPPMCNYRGPLLIHAASTMTGAERYAAGEWMKAQGLTAKIPGDLPLGGIIGRCNVVGHIEPSRSGGCFMVGEHLPLRVDLRWWAGDYGLVLADVAAVPFVACRGALGLRNAPADVLAEIERNERRTGT